MWEACFQDGLIPFLMLHTVLRTLILTREVFLRMRNCSGSPLVIPYICQGGEPESDSSTSRTQEKARNASQTICISSVPEHQSRLHQSKIVQVKAELYQEIRSSAQPATPRESRGLPTPPEETAALAKLGICSAYTRWD